MFIDFLYETYCYQYPKLIVVMFILWLWFLCTKVECIVDFGWVLNHFVIGVSLAVQYYYRVNYRGWVELGILCLWFLLLGGMLFFRVLSGYVDKRYQDLASKSQNKNLYFLFQYQLQAFLITITAAPLYFVFRDYTEEKNEVRWTFIAGGSLSVIGIILQSIADAQLRRYKAKKAEQKKIKDGVTGEQNNQYQALPDPSSLGEDPRFPGVLKSGLWRKSRHPNLFFELVTWTGFFIAGLNDFTISWLGLIGPLFLFFVMNNLTVPITERNMARSRPYWEEYAKETNKFIPF